MRNLIGHAGVELIWNDEDKTRNLSIKGEEFVLEEGGESVTKDGETSTWYLFKHVNEEFGFELVVDFVEVENRIFSYELKSQFLKKDFKAVNILDDELDLSL